MRRCDERVLEFHHKRDHMMSMAGWFSVIAIHAAVVLTVMAGISRFF